MVLDEASPSSSPDPYDTTTTSFSPDKIPLPDISALPRPIPILGSLFGYTPTSTLALIRSRIANTSDFVKRPLTIAESEAIAYHSAKACAISSWGSPLGVIAGVTRYYQTGEKSRFPFAGEQMKPEGWWDGERIRLMGEDVMKGVRARQMVNFMRGSLYVAFGWGIVGLFVNGYAATVTAVGELQDDRLKDVVRVMREQARKELGDVSTKQNRSKRAMDVATGQGSKSASDLWKDHRGAIGADDASPTAAGFDDASPTAAGFDYGDEVARLGGNSANAAVLNDEQMRRQEIRQQPRRSPTPNQSSTFALEKVEPQPRSFDDDYDDATSTSVAHQGESAWERIRRENTSGGGAVSSGRRSVGRRPPARGMQQEQQEGSSLVDSFSFSSSDVERQLARDEAQRKFDERVERERRGGEFGEGERRW